MDRAWGRRGALSTGTAGAPARAEDRRPEGPRVSAALPSPGRVSAPHGQALSGLLLPSKVTFKSPVAVKAFRF